MGASAQDAGERGVEADLLPLARRTPLQLDLALRDAARPHDELPRQADQVQVRELRAGALVAVVIEHFGARLPQLSIDLLAGGVCGSVPGLQVDEAHLE